MISMINNINFTCNQISFESKAPQLGQRELNSFYYRRSIAKRNAEIDMQIKRTKVKVRNLKKSLLSYFDWIKKFKLEFYIK